MSFTVGSSRHCSRSHMSTSSLLSSCTPMPPHCAMNWLAWKMSSVALEATRSEATRRRWMLCRVGQYAGPAWHSRRKYHAATWKHTKSNLVWRWRADEVAVDRHAGDRDGVEDGRRGGTHVTVHVAHAIQRGCERAQLRLMVGVIESIRMVWRNTHTRDCRHERGERKAAGEPTWTPGLGRAVPTPRRADGGAPSRQARSASGGSRRTNTVERRQKQHLHHKVLRSCSVSCVNHMSRRPKGLLRFWGSRIPSLHESHEKGGPLRDEKKWPWFGLPTRCRHRARGRACLRMCPFSQVFSPLSHTDITGSRRLPQRQVQPTVSSLFLLRLRSPMLADKIRRAHRRCCEAQEAGNLRAQLDQLRNLHERHHCKPPCRRWQRCGRARATDKWFTSKITSLQVELVERRREHERQEQLQQLQQQQQQEREEHQLQQAEEELQQQRQAAAAAAAATGGRWR